MSMLLNPYRFGVSGDPHFANVSLLLHCDGSDGSTTFTDSSGNAFTVTAAGAAQIDTAQSKFGGASGLFDGDADYVSVANDAAFQFGSGDFTLEFWVRTTTVAAGVDQILNTSLAGTADYSYAILRSGSSLLYYLSSNGISWDLASGVSMASGLSANTWYHIALVRNGSTFTPYVNGVAGTTTTTATALYNFLSALRIGGISFTANASLTGHMDDVRITKGVARYTANFTPPASAYPDF